MNAEEELEVIDAATRTLVPRLLEGVRVGDHVVGFDDPRMCIGATRMVLDLLKRYMIFGRPLKVHTRTYNRQAWEWQQAHPEHDLLHVMAGLEAAGFTGRDDPRFLHALEQVDLDPRAGMRYCGQGQGEQTPSHLAQQELNGHCVAIMDLSDGRKALVDASAQQFNTPQFKIFLPPLNFEVDEEWAQSPDSRWLVHEEEDFAGAILYRQPSSLEGMFDAHDWRSLMNEGSLVPAVLDAIQREVDAQVALMRL